MKIGSFKNHLGQSRIGIKIGEEKLVDLTAAFEKYLVDETGMSSQRANNVASEKIPPFMLNLICRGKEGETDLKLVADYIKDIVRKVETLFSPSGDKIIYKIEEIDLLQPLDQGRKGRVFNMEYNYPAYKKVWNTIAPDEDRAAMFMMEPETISGPGDDIKWPKTANEVTSAVELGVIIGKRGKRIPKEKALEFVFGYTIVNDLTGMSILRGMGPDRICFPQAFYFTRAMIMDTFQPTGPFITLKDEISNPQNIESELRVNGELVSKGNTKDMRLSVAELIEFLSKDITLEAGDLISTGAIGTMEYPPEATVNIGDMIEAKIDNIGTLCNCVVK